MGVLCLSLRVMAGTKETYDELYSKDETAAIAKGPQAQGRFAAALLKDAKGLGDQKDLQVFLCDRAYQLGMKDPSGYQTAIDAMTLLGEVAPDKKGAALERRTEALQVGCAKGSVSDRKRFGKELVDLLVAKGDEQVAAGQGTEAIASYNKALDFANRGNTGQGGDIKDRISQVTSAAEREKKLGDLKKKLDENPKSVAARMNLIVAYLGEFDTPAEAVKLVTDDLDEKTRTYVPLSEKAPTDLEETACPELAQWYAEIAEKASPAGKSVLLGKSLACCDRYLELHAVRDAARLKVQLRRDKISEERDKLDQKQGQPRRIVLGLGKGAAMDLVLIPAGKFTMGSPENEAGRRADEGPQREVTISKAFYIGACEVTQEQYQAVIGKNPSRYSGAKNPVDQVSWDDSVEFCKKLSARTGKSVRLPTEAQWEYACRAGTKTRFSFGDVDADLDAYGWNGRASGGVSHPVAQKKPNAWGLYDMHGNLEEWCSDWYADSYANAGNRDPQGPDSGTTRVLRGGVSGAPRDFCRSAGRRGRLPWPRLGNQGFRVVMDLK